VFQLTSNNLKELRLQANKKRFVVGFFVKLGGFDWKGLKSRNTGQLRKAN